jgi:hypothetical protein
VLVVVRVRFEQVERACRELASVVVTTGAHELGEGEHCERLRVRGLLGLFERPDEPAVLPVPQHVAQVGEAVVGGGEHRVGTVVGARCACEHVDETRL